MQIPSSPTANEAPFSDDHTPLRQLRDLVRAFIDERSWGDFHSPKNVAISISLEAAELLEHFQWDNPDPRAMTPAEREAIGEEMADILAYLLSLSHVLDIDLGQALQNKMRKNGRKYPTSTFQGNWHKVKD